MFNICSRTHWTVCLSSKMGEDDPDRVRWITILAKCSADLHIAEELEELCY